MEAEQALALLQSPDPVFPLPPHISASFRSFLNLCFARDPSRRPSAPELLAHEFVVNNAFPSSVAWKERLERAFPNWPSLEIEVGPTEDAEMFG